MIGVDFGERHIGIAVGESSPRVANPRPAIAASGTLKRDASAIRSLVEKEEADGVVLGVPETGPMVRPCHLLADRLRELGVRVELVDESGSTLEVQSEMLAMGLRASQRNRLDHGAAAATLLERFFATQEEA